MKTFPRGGVHPPDNKLSRGRAIEALPLPDVVYVPLSQHIGAPAVAKVAKGDRVKAGQLIGEAAGFVSANVHAPVSGTVTGLDLLPNGQGTCQAMITIRREGDEWEEDIDTSAKPSHHDVPDAKMNNVSNIPVPGVGTTFADLEPEEILSCIKRAGIVGMGGAAFPTHVKLTVPAGKRVEILLVNGVECEPYLTSDHRVMLEQGEELLTGVSLLMRALDVANAAIGIENNKTDAIANLRNLCAAYAGITIEPLKVQYPQGGEKQLIAAITGREVPPPPGLPIDVGVVVCNVSTALAVYEAVVQNKPLVERVVTVTGLPLAEPRNFRVRIGTPVSALLAAAGLDPEAEVKILNGGPMMGRAVSHPDAPVTKGCSGITVLGRQDALRRKEKPCIKCAKCVAVCPMGLEPYLLSKLSRRTMWDQLEQNWVTSCIECGCCQYTCPADIPLLDYIRLGKTETGALIRARAAANKLEK